MSEGEGCFDGDHAMKHGVVVHNAILTSTLAALGVEDCDILISWSRIGSAYVRL